MSSGRTHELASFTTAVSLTAVSLIGVHQYGWPTETLLVPAGALAGIIITPDLDYADKSVRPHNVVDHAFGGFVYLVWRLFWWVYGKIIPHRSILSHGPLIGTFGRFMYMWPALAVIKINPILVMGSSMFWWFFLGLAIADTIHWLMDGRPMHISKSKGNR